MAFLDVEMPEMHGLILATHLQGINPNTNIIFVSAAEVYMRDAWKIHASGFLLKPVRTEQIDEELRVLRHAANTRLVPTV